MRCVDALPDHERELLLMRYASEMALSEIAIANIQKLARSRSAYKGRHTAPTLAETGIDPRAQVKLFGEYCRRFGVSSGPAGVT